MTPSMTNPAYTLSLDIDDFRQSRVEQQPELTHDLVEGEICVRVDKIAMTANSISYGFAGKSGFPAFLHIDQSPDQKHHHILQVWAKQIKRRRKKEIWASRITPKIDLKMQLIVT